VANMGSLVARFITDAGHHALPVVVPNGSTLLWTVHYAFPSTPERFVYLTQDSGDSLVEDTTDKGLMAAQTYLGIRVTPTAEFLKFNNEFLVYTENEDVGKDRVTSRMLHEGWVVQSLSFDGHRALYLVTQRAGTSGSQDNGTGTSSPASMIHTYDWFARPVLSVKDVDASLRFYVDRLGFACPWRHAEHDRLYVAQVERQGCALILSNNWPEKIGKALMFISLNVASPTPEAVATALDALRAELEARGVAVKDGWWGYRLLVVADPDGNQLFFKRRRPATSFPGSIQYVLVP
jgi:catechol 2,3-dioxygenase-like lactoylglutathione lyase family enzyme